MHELPSVRPLTPDDVLFHPRRKRIPARELRTLARAVERLLEACDGSRRIVGGRGTASAAYPGFMMVVVDLSRSPRVLVHTLLHELGHLELAEHPRYPSGGDEDARTMRDVVSVVDEEIEAWERGWTIAQRLGLGIDRRAFERTRLRSLKSYLKWAGRRALGTPTVVVSLVRACTPSGRPSRARR